MSIRSRLPRASVAKGPPGISFHSSEAADHLNCTRVSTGHWCGTGLKKAHLTVRVSLARLLKLMPDPNRNPIVSSYLYGCCERVPAASPRQPGEPRRFCCNRAGATAR